MTVVVTLSAELYHGFLERWTSPTERLMYPSRAEQLPDGRMRFKLPDEIIELMREFMLEGESVEDAIERLMAEAPGRFPKAPTG